MNDRTHTQVGWDWFDFGTAEHDRSFSGTARRDGDGADTEALFKAFARCLGSPDGEKVMAHLRALTLERALSPQASDHFLRHLEGQRQLVGYMASLVRRGQAM